MERQKYTREIKLEAVRLIKDRGVSCAQAGKIWVCIRHGFADLTHRERDTSFERLLQFYQEIQDILSRTI